MNIPSDETGAIAPNSLLHLAVVSILSFTNPARIAVLLALTGIHAVATGSLMIPLCKSVTPTVVRFIPIVIPEIPIVQLVDTLAIPLTPLPIRRVQSGDRARRSTAGGAISPVGTTRLPGRICLMPAGVAGISKIGTREANRIALPPARIASLSIGMDTLSNGGTLPPDGRSLMAGSIAISPVCVTPVPARG